MKRKIINIRSKKSNIHMSSRMERLMQEREKEPFQNIVQLINYIV